MQHGECNTREEILKRDGTNVVVDAKCVSTSGTWVCPYTGLPYYQASDIDIDHMVPLKNAWIVREQHSVFRIHGWVWYANRGL